jgi:signal transduction histidine kinase
MIARARPTRRGTWLASRPIRTKLELLLAPPVAALLVLASLLGYTSWTSATSAEQARGVVAVGSAGAELAAHLQLERAAAGVVFARRSRTTTLDAFRQQNASTDLVLERFTAARSRVTVPASLAAPLERLDDQLRELPLLREQVRAGQDVTATTVAFRYRSIIADLIVFRAGLAQLDVDAETATGLRATASLSEAIEGLGLLQTAVLPWLGTEALPPAAQQQIVGAQAAHIEAAETFRLLAPQWSLTAGPASADAAADERLMALAVSATANTRLDLGTDAAGWVAALNARMAQLHAVEAALDNSLLAAVTRQRDAQRRDITLLVSVVFLILLVLAAVGWRVTRSMTRSLRVLADGAMEMALDTLPALVNRMVAQAADSDAIEQAVQRAKRPLPTVGDDEISAVSRAFNSIASQTILLAGDQAQARAAIAQLADTLGYSLQRVLDRVTAKLDELIAATDDDAERMDMLYSIDQRVQPGRVLINNLRVLAGGRAGRPTESDMALGHVVTAAAGQVHGAYNRVVSNVSPDVLIASATVEELVHLLAVLIDNALRASQAPAPVTVVGQRINDRVVLQVFDTGVGIPAVQLAELQHRLTDDASRLDISAVKHMGLPVAGRIARRLGITLTLRSEVAKGTNIDIELPAAMFHIDPHGGRPDPTRPAITRAPRTTSPAAPARRGLTSPADTAVLPAASHPPAPPAVDPPTALLPVVAANQPPPWPPIPAEPPLQIFDQLSTQHPWFTAASTQGRVTPTVPEAWQQAATAAARAGDRRVVHTTTASGLPRRQPGEFTVRTPQMQQKVPRPRDHAAAARGLSSLSASVRSGRPATSPSHR